MIWGFSVECVNIYFLVPSQIYTYILSKYKIKFIKFFFFHEKVLHEKTGCGGSGDGTNILVTVEDESWSCEEKEDMQVTYGQIGAVFQKTEEEGR